MFSEEEAKAKFLELIKMAQPIAFDSSNRACVVTLACQLQEWATPPKPRFRPGQWVLVYLHSPEVDKVPMYAGKVIKYATRFTDEIEYEVGRDCHTSYWTNGHDLRAFKADEI